ncbi:probable disease resistance protein At5g63020 isoform X2 [Miscanthus floridulus]|uniref:probable disease resistance protein At5g63020 isoform X2 n=1 Tax=Miscanthus floridulus TaxID=154761 RepID=UPI0034581AC9
MDDSKCSSDDMLERILQDPHSIPRVMTLEYLKRITDNFSDKRLLGEGGFGKVYKGELENGKMIAVKKFIIKRQLRNPDDQEMQFKNEVVALMSLRHPNIVRCVGYCFETSKKVVPYNGTFVLAESQQEMLLCLEYLTMGSLDEHLQVADFGLAKLLCDRNTQIGPVRGTYGYMAPEYVSEGKITTMADIYSLGVVIIEIITGCKPYPDIDLDIEQIINKWRNKSAEALSSVDCQQLMSCLEIGKWCIKSERNERPTTGQIIKKLSLESIDCSLDSEGPLRKKTKKSCDTSPEDQEEEIIMKIKEHVEKLREKSREVCDKIELAKGNGMVATNKIETWLARADTILSDAMAVCESKQTELNWDTRIAAAQLSQLRECLGDQPCDVAQLPSVLHIDVHAVLLPSQVLFVEQARQHIIEDAEGMIGIWGPVGVGKTLVLKAINNSFETGNSLIPSSSNRRDPPFDFVIYLTTLEDCSVQRIQSEIIQRLKMQDRGDSLTTQATRISKFLQDKSFLVLLDGLYYNLNLAEVGLPPLGNQGQLKRKVVITTRSRSLCDQMCVNRTINVPGLKIDEALELFQECIGNDSLYSEPRIGALAKDLVEQLRALPSELIRIGSAMRGKGEPGQWQNIIGVAKELMHIKDQEASLLTERIVITKLKQCLQNLRGRRNDVNHEIELGKREGKVATNQINNWMASVDTNISVGTVICESEQNELNWDLSVIAAGMLRRLQECLSGQPSVVTVEALPPSVQEMPCSSAEQQPSRVEIFGEAMEYIKDSSVGVIGIWGLGGVGKTHLLTKINNAFLGDSLFHHVIFVTASKEGSVETIQDEIGKKLKLKLPEGDDVKSRADTILGFLTTKKFLILLDDVWNRIDLEAVGIPYPLGNGLQQRRKVVLTTRSKTVCGQMDVKKEINVACLPDDEALQLFQDKVGQGTLSSSPRIEALAKELVEELKGLPLALITVGRAMYGKSNPKQWESAMQHMKQSCCGEDDQDLRMENTVFRRLKFSYDSLRNETLRQCLLTCSLWPEDEVIRTGDLIRCWIGLGLVDECDIHGSYRKAHSLIGELTAACLLDSCDTMDDNVGYFHNNNKAFKSQTSWGRLNVGYFHDRINFNHQILPVDVGVKMHDVIRDMAIWISCGCIRNKDKWVVRAGVGANLSIRTIPWRRAECISLMSSKIAELHPFTGSTNLKRLYLHHNLLDERIFGAIQSFTELTYLDLSRNRIKEIPEELFALVNLEHLDLSRNRALRTVPKRLRELTKLKFLYLAGTGIERIPKEVISCLTELQVIDIMIINDRMTIDYMSKIMQELCTLPNLKAVDMVAEGDDGYESLRKAAGIPIRDLIISGLEETNKLCLAVDTLTGDIAGRTLNELHFESCAMEQIIVGDELGKPFDALSVLVLLDLHNLTTIRMWEGTSSSQALFPRLTHLYVSFCRELQHLSWAPNLPCLEYLHVGGCMDMKQICMGAGQESSKTFPCLKYLFLVDNYQLGSLCGSDVTFACLEELEIVRCRKLKRLPFTVQSLPHKLTKLCFDRWDKFELCIDPWDKLEWEDEGVKSFLERVRR